MNIKTVLKPSGKLLCQVFGNERKVASKTVESRFYLLQVDVNLMFLPYLPAGSQFANSSLPGTLANGGATTVRCAVIAHRRLLIWWKIGWRAS